jgi:hypothetical protein
MDQRTDLERFSAPAKAALIAVLWAEVPRLNARLAALPDPDGESPPRPTDGHAPLVRRVAEGETGPPPPGAEHRQGSQPEARELR